MGHVKFKNHTGQTLNIKLDREQDFMDLKSECMGLNYQCKDSEGCDFPMDFDRNSGKVTKTIITITAKEESE